MILLINPFRVFKGKETEFLDLWDQTGNIFRRSEGYISARLCKASQEQPSGQTAPFTHINVAEWESAELYAEALANPDLRRLAGAYAKVCTFDPALYEIVRDQPPL
ncbi:antibiotic biosynthesis monooxygenase [Sulfitobacter sp. D35]|uniref:antibiotic biosynthesis monooxygenase family protein n=1 Tax=Sulfitobacter sp. D35 TaxID=3083252 RepID=UPI00296E7E90|nr:antibiotic biosynthesis monooxygenase [Sulfitobacter sp. D35]MDW4497884.1 antibiotic biosynthesis monooxygenase [Sulfitobacter sp. D35]